MDRHHRGCPGPSETAPTRRDGVTRCVPPCSTHLGTPCLRSRTATASRRIEARSRATSGCPPGLPTGPDERSPPAALTRKPLGIARDTPAVEGSEPGSFRQAPRLPSRPPGAAGARRRCRRRTGARSPRRGSRPWLRGRVRQPSSPAVGPPGRSALRLASSPGDPGSRGPACRGAMSRRRSPARAGTGFDGPACCARGRAVPGGPAGPTRPSRRIRAREAPCRSARCRAPGSAGW